MILVDTSVWIDFLDGTNNQQTDYLSTSLESEIPIFYTGIILQEILQGFNNKRQQAFIKSEFSKLLLVTPTIDDHIKASDIFTTCRNKGLTIRKSIDCLISALSIHYNLTLLDRDKDFAHVTKCFPLNRVF